MAGIDGETDSSTNEEAEKELLKTCVVPCAVTGLM